MLNTQLSGGFLKKGLYIPFAVGKAVCKFKTLVGLDSFHTDTSAGIPLHQSFQEVGRGVGGLFWVGGQESESGEFVNGGILEQAQFWVSDAAAHIPNQLQFCSGMLVWMTVRTSGLAGQGFHTSIPAGPPEVDIRSVPVVLPAGSAYAVFFRVFH